PPGRGRLLGRGLPGLLGSTCVGPDLVGSNRYRLPRGAGRPPDPILGSARLPGLGCQAGLVCPCEPGFGLGSGPGFEPIAAGLVSSSRWLGSVLSRRQGRGRRVRTVIPLLLLIAGIIAVTA